MKTFFNSSIDFNLEGFNDYFCSVEAAAAEAGETPDYCLPCSYEIYNAGRCVDSAADPDCQVLRFLAAQAMKGHTPSHGREIPTDSEHDAAIEFDLSTGGKFVAHINHKDIYDIFAAQIDEANNNNNNNHKINNNMTTLPILTRESVIAYVMNHCPTVTTNADAWAVENDSDRDDIAEYLINNEPEQITDADDLATAFDRLDVPADDREDMAVIKCGALTLLVDDVDDFNAEARAMLLNAVPADTIVTFHIYGGGGNSRRVALIGATTVQNVAQSIGEEVAEDADRLEIDGDYNTYYHKPINDIDVNYGSDDLQALSEASEAFKVAAILHGAAAFADIC